MTGQRPTGDERVRHEHNTDADRRANQAMDQAEHAAVDNA